jgi:hypothetical protein
MTIPSEPTGLSPTEVLLAFQKLRFEAEDEGYPYMEPEIWNYIEDVIRKDIVEEDIDD